MTLKERGENNNNNNIREKTGTSTQWKADFANPLGNGPASKMLPNESAKDSPISNWAMEGEQMLL